MDNGEIEDIVETCTHRLWSKGGWASNDGMTAPVVFLHVQGPSFITLTNGTLFVKCQECYFKQISAASKLTPART